MRILFVNRLARPSGGAERYVLETARLLEARGVETGLLYGVDGWTDPGFTSAFDTAFPMVDVARQSRRIRPDVVYVHQLGTESEVALIRESGVPVARFFHAHPHGNREVPRPAAAARESLAAARIVKPSGVRR